MKENSSRRSALKAIAQKAPLLAAAASLSHHLEAAPKAKAPALKGRINHSVCKWCYGKIPLEEFCVEVKKMGITGIDLLGPKEWPVVQKHGLQVAMANGAGMGIEKGFNDPALHDQLVKSYEEVIPLVAAAGITNLICFSGNRRGMPEEQGLENAAQGLKRLMPLAEKHKVTLVMELLNSKVNHKDYMCDNTTWGVELCKRVGSDRFKLLYDIYHMQIMEGDIIATIKKHHPYFAHYHTGGVPGRAEIDETQEINYPIVMKAIVDTGFKGFVAQEFIPKREPLVSLKQSIQICDV